MIEVGSDFSGVGAFNQALIRLGIDYKEVFACEMDKFARKTFIHNYGEPEYYPENVYDRKMPEKPLEIYSSTPPCQGFSLAGKREGSILFYNTLEFIKKNKPRFFILENVKGLLSHDSGKTFYEWQKSLGGKSINGHKDFFTREDAAPYHIYWKVLNAKEHGVPQNRERVFIVGIRDDKDNSFSWPNTEPLTKRLKDVLETEVDPKYFLSKKMVQGLLKVNHKPTGFTFTPKTGDDIGNSVTARYAKMAASDNFIKEVSPTLSTNKGEGIKIQVNSGVKKGYEEATAYDPIKFERPTSKTRKGRVGKQVAQTIDTAMHQGVVIQLNPSKESDGKQPYKQNRVYSADGVSPVLDTECGRPSYCIPVLTPDRPNKRQKGRRFKRDGDPSFTITTQDRHGVFDGYTIRRLTPRECFRLMDFPDTFTWTVSDSQAYKQAGNSVAVKMYELIIAELLKINR